MSGGTSRSTRRLQKEHSDLTKAGTVQFEVVGEVSKQWIVTIKGADGTLYQGEEFRLQFTFPPEYPIEAPEVIFLPQPPVHPHIYSNGHICLSILYDGWSPALRVDSVCMSVLSMLSSAEKKEPPIDNETYVRTCSKNPKQTRWVFHDNKA
mmetsp:Transcript_3218/g.5170  ORF Transcript_3218/g.5170 Transcript_3218/m.5170 type:complete len:151 (+) Transcript_3218:591-1043(+)